MKGCHICNKQLSLEEINSLHATDLVLTCKEHNKYRDYANLQLCKIELGMVKEYNDKWKKCAICECDLAQDDIDSFAKTTTTPTCKKHRIASNWWQLDLSKDWFEFSEYVGFDLIYSEDNNKKFQEWRTKKYNK